MRLPDWKTCAGTLAVLAALVLSLPGVRAVHADDEVGVISVNLVDSGLSCDPSPKAGAARSIRLFLPVASDRLEGPHPIALSTQGYSYRPPGVDPEARRLEQR